MICVAASLFLSIPNQVDAQITYTVTGFAGLDGVPLGDGPGYTAVFEIDPSVADSDDDPVRGLYNGAIISSSIVFDDGLVSSVDFAGGHIDVREDHGGGGLFIVAPENAGTFILYQFEPLADDTLPSTPEVMDLPGTFWTLSDETGRISGFTDPADGIVTASFAISFSPVLLGDCNFDGEVNFRDITPFIASLSGNGYLDEADMNEDGEVNFLDIGAFIRVLSSN